MALFRSAEAATLAALDMLSRVERASVDLGDDTPLRIGIGLHTGPLMLGTIGGEERLDTGVVGDAVNIAARIESLTKQYACPLLMSGTTRSHLSDRLQRASVEFDRVAPKGNGKRSYSIP